MNSFLARLPSACDLNERVKAETLTPLARNPRNLTHDPNMKLCKSTSHSLAFCFSIMFLIRRIRLKRVFCVRQRTCSCSWVLASDSNDLERDLCTCARAVPKKQIRVEAKEKRIRQINVCLKMTELPITTECLREDIQSGQRDVFPRKSKVKICDHH